MLDFGVWILFILFSFYAFISAVHLTVVLMISHIHD